MKKPPLTSNSEPSSLSDDSATTYGSETAGTERLRCLTPPPSLRAAVEEEEERGWTD